jgi:histidine kinase
MSIRLKLIFTYILTVSISVFIVVMLLVTMMGRVASSVLEAFVENSSLDEVAYEVIDILVELRHAQEYRESDLVDTAFIQEINARLQFFNSGLVVLNNDTYMNESDYPKEAAFYDQLVYVDVDHNREAISDRRDHEDSMMFEYKGDKYLYFNVAYQVNDQEVIYYFISKMNQFKEFNVRYARGVFLFITFLVLILIAPVVLIVQKDIVKPLRELEKGSRHISEGNLDFRLTTKSRNEVGRVVFSYEKMRQELKKSIQKQVQYENNRKELISSISHDLKTPITSIKGYVEGILDGVANTEEKKERYLKVIHQKSLDMDHLIDDLFLFSKLDLHKMPFDLQPINFPQFVKKISDELALEYQNQGNLEYELEDLSATEPIVSIDANQLKRVIVNLVQNSFKYNQSEEKHVRIQVSNEENEVTLTIKDNGIGMSEEELKHAFDMFYRSDESRNTNTGGSGLGLAIVKQIILDHQGTIKAKSSADKGTSIKIILKKEASVD